MPLAINCVMSTLDATPRRRLLALAALILALASTAQFVALAVVAFPRAAIALAVLAVGLGSASYGVVRRGALHVVGLLVGALLVIVFIVLMVAERPWLVVGALATLGLSVTVASRAFRTHASLPAARRPVRPVVIWNPRSGGGKAARVHLDQEARARGIMAVELAPGQDLRRLVYEVLDGGADALAMAGGDGSQATVARIAAERDIPYACIPAGTRNHFALDLGVDRDDVIGALDALVDGGERRVDLGEVNGRTFVNNVSLGVYGEAVQSTGYRDAKVRTFLATVPKVVGREADGALRWRGPDGEPHAGAAAIVVSNNRYRLAGSVADPSRPRLDEGMLGIAVLAAPREEPGLRAWTAPSYEIEAPGPVHAGVDGESVVLEPPLRFRIRPRALTCRIARHHPGASPAAMVPEGVWDALRLLAHIASGARETVNMAERKAVLID
jgi:diacylglycerol kinase family enzyme